MAYHFHWSLEEILDLEHPLRRAFVGQIDQINARGAVGAGDQASSGPAAE